MKTNLHTHSTWCDGKNTPEEMTLAAIAKGFDTIGFSSHMASPLDLEETVDPARYGDYVADVRRVAAKYSGRIRVLCGAEADYIPGVTAPEKSRYAALGLDYLIGSVHYVSAPDGALVPVDNTPGILRDGIERHFGGDARKYIERYFEQQTEMLAFDFDIVAHVDLVRKFNVKAPYFDESAPWYLAARHRFALALSASGKTTEINTGAISRGWLSEPYPAADFRAELAALGVRMIYSSDSHSVDSIDCGWEEWKNEEWKMENAE